jgi:hypothetical protein
VEAPRHAARHGPSHVPVRCADQQARVDRLQSSPRRLLHHHARVALLPPASERPRRFASSARHGRRLCVMVPLMLVVTGHGGGNVRVCVCVGAVHGRSPLLLRRLRQERRAFRHRDVVAETRPLTRRRRVTVTARLRKADVLSRRSMTRAALRRRAPWQAPRSTATLGLQRMSATMQTWSGCRGSLGARRKRRKPWALSPVSARPF